MSAYLVALLASICFLGLWLGKLTIGWMYAVFNEDIKAVSGSVDYCVRDYNPGVLPERNWYMAAWIDFATAIMLSVVSLVLYIAS
jgi:hypothetical protein